MIMAVVKVDHCNTEQSDALAMTCDYHKRNWQKVDMYQFGGSAENTCKNIVGLFCLVREVVS
jgi:hypothetical protein